LSVLKRRGKPGPGRTDEGHGGERSPVRWRVPGHPIVPAFFVAGELGIVAGTFLNADRTALIGVAWIAAAAIVYGTRFRHATNGAR